MANGRIDNDPSGVVGDPRVAWMAEVAAGRTILGLQDWMAAAEYGSDPATSDASGRGGLDVLSGEGV